MKKTLTRVASAAAVSALAGVGAIAAAAPAQALDLSVWDKVAYCESTDNWSINTGNGFYGGLQFTISTWNAFGGQQYADRADHASKAEQITVARRVLAVQGPGAWPLCSKYAGLTKSNGGADANATLGGSSSSSTTSTTSSTSSSKSTSAPKASSTDSKSDDSKSEAPAIEKAPAKKATAKKAEVAEKKAAKKAKKSKKVVKHEPQTYEVVAGDSLFTIAQAHGIEDWQTIYKLNKSRIDDPKLIYIGQRLVLEEA